MKIRSMAVVIAQLAAVSWVHAQTLPGVASFFQYPAIGLVRLSPDDTHIAMTVRDKDGRMALATCSTDSLKNCNFVLKGDDADIVNFFWVNDKRLAAATGDFQALNISNDGNWFAANADGSEITATDRQPLAAQIRAGFDQAKASRCLVPADAIDRP